MNRKTKITSAISAAIAALCITVVLPIPLLSQDYSDGGVRTHVVKRGEWLGRVAYLYGVSIQDIVATNHLIDPDKILPGTRLKIPRPSEYVVKRGDTLGKIASRLGVSLKALALANGIVDANRIEVGHRLRLPSAALTNAAPDSQGTDVPVENPQLPPVGTHRYEDQWAFVDLTAAESFTDLAVRLKVSEADLRAWNLDLNDQPSAPAGARIRVPARVIAGL